MKKWQHCLHDGHPKNFHGHLNRGMKRETKVSSSPATCVWPWPGEGPLEMTRAVEAGLVTFPWSMLSLQRSVAQGPPNYDFICCNLYLLLQPVNAALYPPAVHTLIFWLYFHCNYTFGIQVRDVEILLSFLFKLNKSKWLNLSLHTMCSSPTAILVALH